MVLSQEEWAEILYSKKPVANTNILPALNRDIDADGKPDGYTLRKGATADLKTGIVTIPAGGQLHISDVVGIEKGVNKFELKAKGKAGTVVTINFFFVCRGVQNYMETKQIRLKTDDWETLTGTVNVKPQAISLHYGVKPHNSKEAIEVKDPLFVK